MDNRIVLPQQPLNGVPLSRTPWGGSRIPEVKRVALGSGEIPERVGESWEVSTGNPFPSKLRDSCPEFAAGSTLESALERKPELLGAAVRQKVGAHSPLLLKWIHAQEPLSVQVHPALGDPKLKAHQEGKPESWLVLERAEESFLYLGFKEGPSREEITAALRSGRDEEVLYRFRPEPMEYICVPAGCVHAIGPGVLLAEPQFCLPGKEGVTLRVSDWGRLYNEQGSRDPQGKPRETHLDQSLETIDWDLPRGDALRRHLCRVLTNGEVHRPGADTPFPVKAWDLPGDYVYSDLVAETYSVLTVWGGTVTLSNGSEDWTLHAGESAFVSPGPDPLAVRLSPAHQPAQGASPAAVGAAFFSIEI